MPIKIQRFLNLAMVVLAWITLPFLGFNNIKRFFPASVLIVFLEFIHVLIGKRRKWWVFYNKPNSYLFNEFPFNIGPFWVGSMWILKWTYGNFKLFILLNALVDGSFTVIGSLASKVKYFTNVRLNKFQIFIYFFYKAFLLYVFQYYFENKKKHSNKQ
ncbi:hypothetical protein [Bacillus sp. EB600]|uniref:hypothetical protein n=1 Tax=Bacillus sp. EB600 TaxID=2806345 RepID=UPI00210B5B60|nr:hypothetical protein [Bacillus sp. EB600]MCQ6282973.1 hypothetical protein [Bacillus sp. EB600]